MQPNPVHFDYLCCKYPSPVHFALYGAIRLGIYQERHNVFICTLILAGTIIIIYGLHYVAYAIALHGIGKIYWPGFVGGPAYIFEHGIRPAVGFCAGSLLAKAFQHLKHRKSGAANKQITDPKKDRN